MALSPVEVIKNKDRRETKPHGTAAFPCAGYENTVTQRRGEAYPWHWHEEMEVVYLEAGELEVRFISRRYKLHTGEMVLINSNAMHYARAVHGCTLQSLVFSPRLITGSDTLVFATKYVTPLCHCHKFVDLTFPAGDDNIARFLQAFHELKNDTPGYEFTVREQLSRLVMAAYWHYEKDLEKTDTEPDTDSVRIAQMLDYIHHHFPEHISLSDISASAAVGEREALRCFKRTIQESPMQYLMKYRLMQSADMLRNHPGENISDIAGECGFDSPSYYTRKFHELFQCTPREYVHALQSGQDLYG